MSGIILGIDLGTTNSVVAVADGEKVSVLADEAGNRLIPSVVSFHPERRILVGEEARDRRLIDAKNTVYSVKRLIGRPFKSPEVTTARSRFAFDLTESGSGGVVVSIRDETYTLTEISAFVLREVRRIAEARLDQPVSRAVITVPANFNELQRSATKAAGRVAGMEVARIINEPTAAALAYGYGKQRAEKVAVFDLGGGTFDLTILELDADVFEVVATAGDSFLGGDDIDLIISEAMADQFLRQHRYDVRNDAQAFERLRAASEWAKCQLSNERQVAVTVEELAYGDSGQALDLAFQMTRSELELRMRPTLDKSIDVCKEAMKRSGLTVQDIDSVILVGGSTRVPLVRELVTEFFGQAPRQEIDPDLVVAQGAALHALSLAGPRAKRGGQALGKVQLKKVSLTDLRAAQAAKATRQESLPKGPAFAPSVKVVRPAPPSVKPVPRPGAAAISAARAAKPAKPPAPIPSPVPQARGISAVPAIAVGKTGRKPTTTENSGLLDLDDPMMRGDDADMDPPPKKRTLMPGSRPSSSTSNTEGSGLLILDDPSVPDVRAVILGVSQATGNASTGKGREPTAPFGTGSGEKIAPPSATTPSAQKPPGRSPKATSLGGLTAPAVLTLDAAKHDTLDNLLDDYDDVEVVHSPSVIVSPTTTQTLSPDDIQFVAPERQRVNTEALSEDDIEMMIGTGLEEPMNEELTLGDALPTRAAPLASSMSAPTEAEISTPVLAVSGPAPLLMDVTPLSLGLETVGGYSQHLIRRNTPIPTEQSRVFTTGQDGQLEVEVRICQGDSRVYEENQALGSVLLTGLRDAPRGGVRIEVTFILDASGTLDVKAVDVDTGTEQVTRIDLLGGVSEDDIEAMAARQSAVLG